MSTDRKKHSLEGFVSSTVPLSLVASRNDDVDDDQPQNIGSLQDDTVFDADIEGISQPLKPRDVEHVSLLRDRPLSSDSDVASMHTVLMQLDKQEE